MYFSTYTIITTLAALASAATITPLATKEETRRQVSDPHVVDFRTYGAPGCFDDNQGVYTYEESNVGICYEFVDVPVESIFVTDITDGCSVYAYTDSGCAGTPITVPVGIANCYNSTVSLTSFETVC